MRQLLRHSLCALFLLALVAPAAAQEKSVERFVEFRDGSIMKLPLVDVPWTVTRIHSTGKVVTGKIRPSDIRSVTLTLEEDFEKKRTLLSSVQQLGAEDFTEREKAWQTLFEMGPSIAPDLHTCLQLTSDVETKARLYQLIRKFDPKNEKKIKGRVVFDRFLAEEPFWGYIGDSPLIVVYSGKKFQLNRKDVSRISEFGGGAHAQGVFRRIELKDFPSDCAEEHFEKNPNTSKPLKTGKNINKAFVSRGFVLSAAVENSYIAANDFTVGGKSGGLSIANHQPLWEGEVIIRFVYPGKEYLPGGVTHFGCFVAAVVPEGTALIGYDLQDREIGRIYTEKNNTEFLGVQSEIPIHKIRIVPIEGKDTNVTVDDFIFKQAPSVQASHPDKCLAELISGDAILCKDVTVKDSKVELHGMPAGLPNLVLPLHEIRRLNPPGKGKDETVEGLYAELDDGSIIFAPKPADQRKKPAFAKSPNLLEHRKNLVGVWTSKSGRKIKVSPGRKEIVWDHFQEKWQEIDYYRFLEELVLWRKPGGKFGSSGYEKFTTMWLDTPKSEPEPGSWHVQTVTGEDLVVPDGQDLAGKLTKSITVNWRNQSLTIDMSNVMSIYQVPAP